MERRAENSPLRKELSGLGHYFPYSCHHHHSHLFLLSWWWLDWALTFWKLRPFGSPSSCSSTVQFSCWCIHLIFILIHTKFVFLSARRVLTQQAPEWLLCGINASAIQRFFQDCSILGCSGIFFFIYIFHFTVCTLRNFNPSLGMTFCVHMCACECAPSPLTWVWSVKELVYKPTFPKH